ncbi:hypothetical protein GCM10028820_03070 [Tessaracoccus terricola]
MATRKEALRRVVAATGGGLLLGALVLTQSLEGMAAIASQGPTRTSVSETSQAPTAPVVTAEAASELPATGVPTTNAPATEDPAGRATATSETTASATIPTQEPQDGGGDATASPQEGDASAGPAPAGQDGTTETDAARELGAARVQADPDAPAFTPSQSQVSLAAGEGSVYIDEPLQGGTLTNWELQGSGNESNSNGSRGTSWTPRQTTVSDNNNFPHSYNTKYCGVGITDDAWPRCTATRNNTRDSAWLTLTTDNTNDGAGQAGTALHTEDFSSDLGVVLEYDQRVYRTNDGRQDGTPANQGGGDGIAVYLTDAAPPNYGNTAVDTSVGKAGGYGAGLGYSAVSDTGNAWCPAQQGVAGGYIGVGFDVYGNYQKAETAQGFGTYHRATRPYGVASGNPAAFEGVSSALNAARIPQSIGLRGSGVRYNSTPGCNSGSSGGMNAAYGMIQKRLVTNADHTTLFQVKWNSGDAASLYVGQYSTDGSAWTAVTALDVPAADLPSGFSDPRGYVMFKVDTVAAFDFRYSRDGVSAGDPFQNINGSADGDGDVSLGNAPDYTPLYRYVGGYRWLAGTDNLSAYPNPNNTDLIGANDAARRGAVIDNSATDSTKYRRIRVTLTPKADGTRTVRVYWTKEKLNVADDKCYTSQGVELEGRYADGSIDTCLNPTDGDAGTWSHDKGDSLAYEEMFSYDLAASSYQADLPANFRLGFSASTGWAVNYHQIRNVTVTSVIDLEVAKQVAFIGDDTTPPETVTWLDEDTGRAGENVAYRVQAWNNGASDMLPAYPATLVDGLDAVPFGDVAAVTWTATATDGALLCTDWDTDANVCRDWDTELTGTGALTQDNPLRWYAPSRTTVGADESGITVTFVGAVSDGTDGQSEIVADQWYPNTAVVAASPVGGPQEDNLENNTDTAQIEVTPELHVTKVWWINGVEYGNYLTPPAGDEDALPALPDGFGEAQPTLAPMPTGVTEPAFGERYPYDVDDIVTIGEDVTIPDTCELTSSVTAVNGSATDTALGDGFNHTVTASPLLNTVEITNSVTCSTLTLVKTLVNPDGLLDDTYLAPGDWILSATAVGADPAISQAPTVEVSEGDVTTLATQTVAVAADSYRLAETSDAVPGVAYAASLWSCTAPDEDSQAVEVPVSDGVVDVGPGQDVTCALTNSTAELTVLKQVVGDRFAPADFTLTAVAPDTPEGLPGLETDGSEEATAENSVLVLPGADYTLGEAPKNPDLPYLQRGLQRYVPGDECPATPTTGSFADDDCWSDVDSAEVSLEPGERGIFRFVNTTPAAPVLPFTGGTSAELFAVIGGLLLLGAAATAALARRRRTTI